MVLGAGQRGGGYEVQVDRLPFAVCTPKRRPSLGRLGRLAPPNPNDTPYLGLWIMTMCMLFFFSFRTRCAAMRRLAKGCNMQQSDAMRDRVISLQSDSTWSACVHFGFDALFCFPSAVFLLTMRFAVVVLGRSERTGRCSRG